MFLEINNTGDSRGYRSAEEQARDLTISLKREVSRVSEQWNSLLQRSDQWQRSLNDSIKVWFILYFNLLIIFLDHKINYFCMCLYHKSLIQFFLNYHSTKSELKFYFYNCSWN